MHVVVRCHEGRARVRPEPVPVGQPVREPTRLEKQPVSRQKPVGKPVRPFMPVRIIPIIYAAFNERVYSSTNDKPTDRQQKSYM